MSASDASDPRTVTGNGARTRLKLKSQWFKLEQVRSPAQEGGVLGFTAWRLSVHVVRQMRAANFDIDPGPQYFAVVQEFLAFLCAVADRMIYARGDEAARLATIGAMAHKAGDVLEENMLDLMGEPDLNAPERGERRSYKEAFIALVNLRMAEYADFGMDDSGPDAVPAFGFVRYLGACITEWMVRKDAFWALGQVMQIEAPEAVAELSQVIHGLAAPVAARRPSRRLAGD